MLSTELQPQPCPWNPDKLFESHGQLGTVCKLCYRSPADAVCSLDRSCVELALVECLKTVELLSSQNGLFPEILTEQPS